MPSWFGPLLTNIPTADAFCDYYRAGGFSCAKVVTSWGLDEGWNDTTRRKIVDAVPRLIVRTTAGDPSNSNADAVLYPDTVVAELRPWVELRPDIIVELGNEPDVWGYDEILIWQYRYFLMESIAAVRANFPKARIIGPAVRVNHDLRWKRWVSVLADALGQCDLIGIHLYGYHRLLTGPEEDTHQYVDADTYYRSLFPNNNFAVTELGIHDTSMAAAEKIRRYREFARSVTNRYAYTTFYHINERRDIHPEYAIPQPAVLR